MHDTAMLLGKKFFKMYLDSKSELHLLDVGSCDVNGTLRDAASPAWKYTGLDLEQGKGVDVVLDDPYSYPFSDNTFDAIVSSSCLEHDSMFWLSFCEMLRVLKPGGYLYINAPSNGVYHTHPVDNWRFYPDAGIALETWGRRNGLAVTLCESFVASEIESVFNDFVAVFWKGKGTPPKVVDFSNTTGGAMNIHLHGKPKVLNYSEVPPDMLRYRYFQNLCTKLNARVQELEKEIKHLELKNK